MNKNITMLSVIYNPLNDYIKSLSKIKDKKLFWSIAFYFLIGFTGLPMIKLGEVKKGLIILFCLVASVGSTFVFDIVILRQVLCLVWLFNYFTSFRSLLQTTNKNWFFKLMVYILLFIPIELAVVYLFQLAK